MCAASVQSLPRTALHMFPCQALDADDKLLDRCTDVQLVVTDMTQKKPAAMGKSQENTFKLTGYYM